MLARCAADAHLRVTRHSIAVRLGERLVILPKGPGVPQAPTPQAVRGVRIPFHVVRMAVEDLALDRACVGRFFPELG